MTDLLQREFTHEYHPKGWFLSRAGSNTVVTYNPTIGGVVSLSGLSQQNMLCSAPAASTWADGDTVTVLVNTISDSYNAYIGLRYCSDDTKQSWVCVAASATGPIPAAMYWQALIGKDNPGSGTDFGASFDIGAGSTPYLCSTYRFLRFRRVNSGKIAVECAQEAGGVPYGDWELIDETDTAGYTGSTGNPVDNIQWNTAHLALVAQSGHAVSIIRCGYATLSYGSAPVVTAQSVTSGPARTTVTLTGTGFTDVDGVWINDMSTPVEGFRVVSSTRIDVTIPDVTFPSASPFIVATKNDSHTFGAFTKTSGTPTGLRSRIDRSFFGTTLPSGWGSGTTEDATVTVGSGLLTLNRGANGTAWAGVSTPVVDAWEDGDYVSLRLSLVQGNSTAVAVRQTADPTDDAPGVGVEFDGDAWSKPTFVSVRNGSGDGYYAERNDAVLNAIRPAIDPGDPTTVQWVRVRRVTAERLALEFAPDASGAPGTWVTGRYFDTTLYSLASPPYVPDWDAMYVAVDTVNNYSESADDTIIVGFGAGSDPEPDPDDPLNDRITYGQRAALQQRHASVFLWVDVKDATDTWQDLSDVFGADHVMSAVIVDQLETPAQSCTITVRGGKGGDSIAPLVTAATANSGAGRLLDVARGARVRIAVTSPTIRRKADVPAGAIVTVFLGTIDRISTNDGQLLTLSCRDLLVPILDATFRTTRTYGNGSIALQTVLQSMLDDALGTGVVDLFVPTSPAWAPPLFTAQRGESLWAKIVELCDQIGWVVRQRFNGPDTSETMLLGPNRDPSAADYTFLPIEVREVQEAAIDLAGVRNRVQIAFYPSGGGSQSYYTTEDSSSIAAYRLRELIIAEARSSQINSYATAKRMGDAIVSDVALPTFSHTVRTTHPFWPAAPGDVIDVPANDVTHDATQRLAVIATTLTLENGGGSAVLQMRGKPASKGKAWLRLAGPSGDPATGTGSAPAFSAAAITNTGSSGTSGSLVLTWTGTDFPSGGSYEVVKSGSSYVTSGTVTGATSPLTIATGVYTDGVAPPSSKIGPDFVSCTINMKDSSGAVVATRSVLSAGFFHL